MTHQMVHTENVRRFMFALNELTSRGVGMEGMGLLWGRPGEGKTSTITYAAVQGGGLYVRANAAWRTTAMLNALMRELGLQGPLHAAQMIDAVVESLSVTPRTVYVDEADYLLRDRGHMLDVLRDIYDLSGAPVMLIGMEEFAHKLTMLGGGRFRRRITQWVEFAGLSEQDVRLVVDTVADVEMSDDLVAHLHRKCEANIGRVIIGVGRIESFARANSRDRVTLDDYGARTPLFLTDPAFRGARRPTP